MAVAIGLVAAKMQAPVVVSAEAEEVRHVMKEQWIDLVVVAGTDDLEVRGFDNKWQRDR